MDFVKLTVRNGCNKYIIILYAYIHVHTCEAQQKVIVVGKLINTSHEVFTYVSYVPHTYSTYEVHIIYI